MKNIRLIIIFLLISATGFSKGLDTINVFINVKQIDSLGLRVDILLPDNLNSNILYQFPNSIPGIYEYSKSQSNLITLTQNGEIINGENNSYKLSPDNNKFHYSMKNSVDKFNGIAGEDFYFLKDSIYIFNWHYLLGFFQNETNRPYKIEIVKNKKLFGAGALTKTVLNDSTDIYTATNYKELIHNPVIYSIPDTTSFRIGNTKFNIACAGNDTTLNSLKIKELIYNPLSEIYSKTSYKHKEYSFLYYSEYSLTAPYLTGLEHPNSTLICYHSALLDNNILISSSIHEFIHSIYAPLRIRSEIINNFDFTNPSCDEFLWFYEGTTEYLAIKTLVNSGFFLPQDFLNELNESNKYHKNINLSKVSSNIYDKKEQMLFDNFYTKGSLFAMQLDIELIKHSNGKIDLFDVMQNLQKSYNPKNPFNSNTFIIEFSKISGVDLQEYITKKTRKKTKIDFEKLIDEIGYTKEFKDTTIWTYHIKKSYLISDYKKNRFEIAVLGSKINKELNIKKVTIYEINGEPLTWYNYKEIFKPENGEELSLKAYTKAGDIEFTAKPEQKLKDKTHINWIKNRNIESEVAQRFWNN